MKNYIDFRLYENDIIYLLNCIILTKKILQDGNETIFGHYFKKSNYFEYVYDLTLLQKLISNKGNSEIYNYENNDFFVGQQYWLNNKDKNFDFLKGKKRQQMLKDVKNEIQQIKFIEQKNKLREQLLSSIDNLSNDKYFSKKFTFFTKYLDKKKIV